MRALVVSVVLLAACDKTPPPTPTPTPDKPDKPDMTTPTATGPVDPTLAQSTDAFALALWAKASTKPGNLAVSPTSIAIALAMTAGGAKGDTLAELRRALQLAGAPEDYGKLAAALQGNANALALRIANRLFGEKSFAFEQAFLAKTKATYGAPLEPLDFKGAAEAARGTINHWVEDQTEKRIKDLLPAGALTDTTRMVLVNAIYFLADWQSQFEKQSTSPRPFSLTATTKKSVDTMHQVGQFRIAKIAGGKLLELPYKGGSAAMWIALPDATDGLAAFERTLDAKQFASWPAAFQSRQVLVALPRFTIDPAEPLALRPQLEALGITKAFSDRDADFTGIGTPSDANQRLYISAVFHKAFVKVDENGTEAAAATAVVMAEGTGAPAKREEVIVDHPFLFFIVDKPSGLILFMGRVVDPA